MRLEWDARAACGQGAARADQLPARSADHTCYLAGAPRGELVVVSQACDDKEH